MIFYGTSFNEVRSADKSEEHSIPESFLSQQVPFYFLNSIPAAVKLSGKINLSFFRNQSIVFQYRYKLELPYGSESDIDRKFITWSVWTKDNLTEFAVPRLDQEGGYKLIIEYMTPELGETRKFEKPFYVYRGNPKSDEKIAESKPAPANDKPPAKKAPDIDKTPARPSSATDKTSSGTKPVTTPATGQTVSKTAVSTEPVTDTKNKQPEKLNENQASAKYPNKEIKTEPVPSAGIISAASSDKNREFDKIVVPDYNKLLAEAIERKDAALFRNSIQNGASFEIKGTNGGNIFHIIDGTLGNEEMISIIKDKGISINEMDNFGNSPLHLAILYGERDYATSLINQGADINLKNNLELSPLHLAAYLDDDETLKHLLNKGAEIDIRGNSGYTPLHIAAEMNHAAVARDLLLAGAKSKMKTNQKFTPKTIARIQRNPEMNKLIRKKGSNSVDSPEFYSANNITRFPPVRQNPEYDFNLPYDNGLVKSRNFTKVVQIISIPILIAGTSFTAYLNHEANGYYSLYKRAESEEVAKGYYNKTKKYDSYTYIVGGISLVNLYGLIHSTLKKKSITDRMYKTFNY